MAGPEEITPEQLNQFFADMDEGTEGIGNFAADLLGEAIVQVEDRLSTAGTITASIVNKINAPIDETVDALSARTRALSQKMDEGAASAVDSLSERVAVCRAKAQKCGQQEPSQAVVRQREKKIAEQLLEEICPSEDDSGESVTGPEAEKETGFSGSEVQICEPPSPSPPLEAIRASDIGTVGDTLETPIEETFDDVSDIDETEGGDFPLTETSVGTSPPSVDLPADDEPPPNIFADTTVSTFNPPPLIQIASPGELGLITQCRPDLYTSPTIIRSVEQSMAKALLGNNQAGGTLSNILGEAVRASGLQNVPFIGPQITTVINNLARVYDNLITSSANAIGCGTSATLATMLSAGRDVISQYVSPSFGEITLPLDYARRSLCPTEFPSEELATNAFLANAISPGVYKSWLKLNNVCPEPWAAVTESRRTKLIPNQLIDLRLRKKISKKRFEQGLRQVGYTDKRDWNHIWSLGEALPGLNDVIRFMVRDVVNDQVVERFGLDSGFTDNYKGKLRNFGEAQGIGDEFAKFAWRAHWTIPAPFQLFEMLHRLPQIGGFGSHEEVLKDVEIALKQQDILPFWIPRLIAINERPITRRDIYRGLQTGAIAEDEVKGLFRQLGHSFKDSEILADTLIRRRDSALRNSFTVRLWRAEAITADQVKEQFKREGVNEETANRVVIENEGLLRNTLPVKYYARGFITNEQATKELTRLGVRSETIRKWLREADLAKRTTPVAEKYDAGLLERDAAATSMLEAGMPKQAVDRILNESDTKFQKELAKRCATAVRKRFITGDLSRPQTKQALINSGFAPTRAEEYLSGWACEKEAIGKQAPTSTITKWFREGIITMDEAISRLKQLGWDNDDINNIITQAANAIAGDNAKELREAIRKAKAEIEKGKKEFEKEQKRQQNRSARQVRSAERKERAKLRIAKELSKASNRFAKKAGLDASLASNVINQAFRVAMKESNLSQDEAMQAIVIGSESPEIGTPGEFNNAVRVAIGQILDIENV